VNRDEGFDRLSPNGQEPNRQEPNRSP